MSESGPALDGSHGPHVLVDDVTQPSLAADDRHHLERVLRLRHGEPMTVGDGAGHWRACLFGAELAPVDEPKFVALAAPPIAVGFALMKGGRPELVVQKLTELGVDRIVPFVAERSIVRWDGEKAERNTQRFRRVAREAVMQSRRAWLPEIGEVVSFAELVAEPGAALADHGGDALTRETSLVLTGPEGGWSDTERNAAVPRVVLGRNVLRAETAAITAGVLLGAQRGFGPAAESP